MRPPDQSSPTVKVWRISESAAREPQHEANVATWIIDSHAFHPAWHQWMFSIVSLRDIEGVPPAHKQYPEAEYELLIMSLNPDRPVDIDELEGKGNWGDEKVAKFLTPADLVYQFDGVTEQQATEIGEASIRGILAGELSPDSDYRSIWKRLLDGTVAHYKAGVHGS